MSFDVPDVPPVTVVLEPGQPIHVEGLTGSARAGVSIVWSDPSGRLTLLRAGELLTVDAASIELTAGLTVDGSDIEPDFGVVVSDLGIALGSGDADSFVASLLPRSIGTTFGLGVEWTADGFRLNGGVALTMEFPLNLALGPIDVQSVTLALAFGEQLDLDVTFAIAAQLGPIGISVGGVGVSSALAVADGVGTLGPLTIATPSFKPPNRIGIDVEVGAVSRRRLPRHRPRPRHVPRRARPRAPSPSASAPSRSSTPTSPEVDGWSMFFALFIDLPAHPARVRVHPQRASAAWSAINRTLDVEALQSAVRSGALDAVLFPEDPIADAPDHHRASCRRSSRPPPTRYVFGPVVQIGWGTPPLIEAELGIVIAAARPDRDRRARLGDRGPAHRGRRAGRAPPRRRRGDRLRRRHALDRRQPPRLPRHRLRPRRRHGAAGLLRRLAVVPDVARRVPPGFDPPAGFPVAAPPVARRSTPVR